MSKQLPISVFREENKLYEEFIEIPVTAQGLEYIVKLFPFFSPEKIRDLVKDLVEFCKAAVSDNIHIDDIEQSDVVGYFILKHFTDVKFSKSKKAKNIYAEFKAVLNAKVFQDILKSFPESSVNDVWNRIHEVLAENEKVQKRMENKVKEAKVDLHLIHNDVLLPHYKGVE
jgi:hypothetical protein